MSAPEAKLAKYSAGVLIGSIVGAMIGSLWSDLSFFEIFFSPALWTFIAIASLGNFQRYSREKKELANG